MWNLYLFILFFITSPIFAIEYTIGVDNIDYLPYYAVNRYGDYIGFAKELFDLFSVYEGINFIYEARTTKKLSEEYLIEKRFDFKFPDNSFWDTKAKNGLTIYYSNPICSFTDGIISLKDFSFSKDSEIGTILGYTVMGFKENKILESPTVETLLEKLKNNNIAGAYLNIDVALNKINKNNKYVFNKNLPYFKSSYFLSSISHPEVIHDFNQFLSSNKNEINQLKVKYGIKD